ncbi:MAG: serine hydrolase, partial [Henriciella sp.]|nr:serine hydrolase [Henriciella sp.]
RLFLLTLCVPSLILTGCSHHKNMHAIDEAVPAESNPDEQSRAAMETIAKDYPALSATVIRADRVVWSYQHGKVRVGGDDVVTPSTRFTAYSTAKVVTGLAFGRLVEQGQLNLDASVAEIAPDLPVALHRIRVRDILSHTSGIRHYTSPRDWISFAEKRCLGPLDALDYFGQDALLYPPSTAESYSTFAFVLASELLVRITGESDFVDALNQILEPKELFILDQPDADKAQPFIRAGRLPQLPKNLKPDDLIASPFQSAECKFGGGGLLMSSEQLASVGASLHNGQIFPISELPDRLKPWSDVSGVVYGGGVQTRTMDGQSVTLFSASGGAPGGRSVLVTLVEPQISIAIAGNLEGPRLEDMAWKLAEIWIESQPD